MGIAWRLDWGESHPFTESGQEPEREPVRNHCGACRLACSQSSCAQHRLCLQARVILFASRYT